MAASEITQTYPGPGLDTFPKLLLHNARMFPNKDAMREKEFGIWQSWTWEQVADEIERFSLGLQVRGIQKGDKVLIIGANRPRMYWTMVAAQVLGAIPVPTYKDSVAEEMQYVIEHSEARFVIAEDQEQVDKVLEVKDRCPMVELVIYDDPRGMKNYDTSVAVDFEVVQQQGADLQAKQSDLFKQLCSQGKGEDVSIILYTSGTTGKPKGVVLTYDNVLITAYQAALVDGLTENDEILCYLPIAWVGDHIFVAQSYCMGFCVNCPESEETVAADMREIGPTYYFAPPRVFEGLLTNVQIRMEDAAPIKRKMYSYFMGVAKRVGIDLLEGKSIGLIDRLMYAIGNFVIYGPLKDALGLGRVRLAWTAGEAIGGEIFDFYRSLGINIKQLYGQTESSVFITAQPDGEVYPETVGRPSPGVELHIADDGEVLYRSPGAFHSYYKNPQSTADTKTAEGWVHTGDAGFINGQGHLRIIDRAKDVGKFNDGKMFAPKHIENKLKFFPHIQEAVTFGDGKDHCMAFINIDLGAVGNWAERNNVAYASYQELAANPNVYEMVKNSVEQVNQSLLGDEMLSHSQISRFLILHKELDADDGELTRTKKVRRALINDRYGALIEALYNGAEQCFIETEIAFEDGRVSTISGDIKIVDVKTFSTAAKAS
ncbi:MAG: long-chain fatty acid--CoA ligase [Gammaproteobacteria bacterium]|nr:long-chain fatty acid--CoA ligase [Gammaproteobacteria bacterium]MCP4882006.1 long-chain fatty acid--CoA ligase [Gammaproteobacteria bacterium]